MSRLRVLHFLDHVAGDFFPNFVRALDHERFDVYFWVLHGIPAPLRDDLEAHGVRVIDDGTVTRRDYPLVASRLLRRLHRFRIDVLHAHNFHASAIGMAVGRLSGVPACLLTRHHADAAHLLDKPWHRRIDQLSSHLAELTVANSNWTASVLVSREHIPARKVRVVHYGIDLRPFVEVPSGARASVRRQLGLGAKLVITVAGRLDAVKGHTFLLDATRDVVRSIGPDVTLLVVGSGPWRGPLEEQARRLELDDHVRFLGYRSDMPAVLAASDVVVVPSVSEAFGLILVEAMACGTAVVASDVGGIPEVVTDGKTGLLVPPRSATHLAQAIVTLHDDPRLRSRLGAEAQEDVCERFQLQRMVSEYERIYAELAGPNVSCRVHPRALERLNVHP